jgi:hypothetical protein
MKHTGSLRWLLTMLIVALPGAAVAWPPLPGSPGHSNQEVEPYVRGSDRVEAPQPTPPAVTFPGLPGPPRVHPPLKGTKTGPMTTADLHLTPDGKGGYRGYRPGYKFSIDPDGTIHFADRPSFDMSPAYMLGMVGLVGTFDLTDYLMRLHGEDPYSFDKGRVIVLSRDMRTKMTDTERAKLLQRAIHDLPRRLAFLWGRSDLSAKARRGLLFSLWDELLDGSATATTSPEGKAALEAREMIETFVRDRLPPSGPDAYPAAELAQLNAARRSRSPFAPYDKKISRE